MLKDLRYGARVLLKTPSFTLIAVLALALGIGASTTNFSSINALLLRPMPLIHDQDRLVYIAQYFTKLPDQDTGTSLPDFLDWKKQVTSFEGLGAMQEATFIVSGGDKPERYLGGQISAETFSFLGVQPILGRQFRPEEDQLNAPPVALIGYDLWENHFGADRAIVGKSDHIRRRRLDPGATINVLVLTYNRTLRGYVNHLATTQTSGALNVNVEIETFANWAKHRLGVNWIHSDSGAKVK